MKKMIVCSAMASVVMSSLLFGQTKSSPEQMAEDYRVGLMNVLQGNLGPLAAMARGRTPYDAAVVKKNSERMAFLATMVADAFAADTSGAGLKTASLPIVWKENAEFQKMAQDLVDKTSALATAAKAGNDAAAKAAIGAAGTSCGACHDKYREMPQ